MTTEHELLDAAKAAVVERGLSYGKPEDNFERIAARWRAHLKNRFGMDVPIDPISVALMCADLKMARLENQPDHLDSWTDLAGYAACGAEIAVKSAAEAPLDMAAVQKLLDRVHEWGHRDYAPGEDGARYGRMSTKIVLGCVINGTATPADRRLVRRWLSGGGL